MKPLFYTIALLFATITTFASENIDTLITRAETYYAQKQYDSALVSYLQVYDQNLQSADLFYNIGNTYFRLDDLGHSILWYERALLVNPKHHEARVNLEFVNARQIDKVEVLPQGIVAQFFQKIYLFFNYTTWAVLSLVFLALFLAAVSGFLFAQTVNMKKLSFGVGIFALVIAVLSFTCTTAHKNFVEHNNEAIIVEPTIVIKNEPNKKATDLVTVHEGLKVHLVKTYGEWANVRLLDGKEGWVRKSDVEKIVK
ncbi:MAG: tetratricopeptide repeat protein [Bacteroidales bacterium]|jgi:tetratricopeptide (TPR) repeat protein|nr:tetratricopeptide repeat protein [Bacteroidales bacterium]